MFMNSGAYEVHVYPTSGLKESLLDLWSLLQSFYLCQFTRLEIVLESLYLSRVVCSCASNPSYFWSSAETERCFASALWHRCVAATLNSLWWVLQEPLLWKEVSMSSFSNVGGQYSRLSVGQQCSTSAFCVMWTRLAREGSLSAQPCKYIFEIFKWGQCCLGVIT